MKQPAAPETEAKRQRCANCPRFFEVNPRTKQRFCSAACRKEHHRYGSSGFLKLREVALKAASEIEQRNEESMARAKREIEEALAAAVAEIKRDLAGTVERELDQRVGAVR